MTTITGVRLSGAGRASLPLLVVGPDAEATAIGTWAGSDLAGDFDVVAWDLPGLGYNTARPEEPVTLADLAQALLAMVEDVLAERGDARAAFVHAGAGLGGEVGVRLLLDAPDRVAEAIVWPAPTGAEAPRWLTPYDVAPLRDTDVPRLTRLPDAAALRRHLLGDQDQPAAGGLDDRTAALVRLVLAVTRGADPATSRREALAAGATSTEVDEALRLAAESG